MQVVKRHDDGKLPAIEPQSPEFAYTLEFMPDAVMVIDGKGAVIQVNSSSERTFARSRQDLLNRKVNSLIPTLRRETYKALRTGYSFRENPRSVEINSILMLKADGTSFYGDVAVKPFQSSVDNFLVISIHRIEDATKKYPLQKSEKQTREQSENKSQHAEKMQSIGQLTAGIAHDFNNMLTSILGFAELSERHNRTINYDHKLNTYLDQIINTGERAQLLIQQMLAFGQADKGTPMSTSPEYVIRQSLETLRPYIPAGVELKIINRCNDVKINIDPSHLQKILTNLIINAQDAIDEKGYIHIYLDIINKTQDYCDSCHMNFSGRYLQILIKDNGLGINPMLRRKIFEPFFTTKEIGKGRGMGLSVVHGLAHGNDGHIKLQSEIGKGTSATLLFPINETPKLES